MTAKDPNFHLRASAPLSLLSLRGNTTALPLLPDAWLLLLSSAAAAAAATGAAAAVSTVCAPAAAAAAAAAVAGCIRRLDRLTGEPRDVSAVYSAAAAAVAAAALLRCSLGICCCCLSLPPAAPMLRGAAGTALASVAVVDSAVFVEGALLPPRRPLALALGLC